MTLCYNISIMRKSRTVVGAGLLAGALFTSGCAGGSVSAETPRVEKLPIRVSVESADSRLFECLTYTQLDRGGIRCNDVTESPNATEHHNPNIHVSLESLAGSLYYCFAQTQARRGGLDCHPVEDQVITTETSQLQHYDQIRSTTIETPNGLHGCLVYTAALRGGMACVSLAAAE